MVRMAGSNVGGVSAAGDVLGSSITAMREVQLPSSLLRYIPALFHTTVAHELSHFETHPATLLGVFPDYAALRNSG
jgi:hypothetical protein